jgi:predicted DNA-binding antitoxin AbrB/MazE fold protein
MTRTISAIFDAGVFRPLEPVGLADGTQVELQLEVSAPGIPNEVNEETKKAWQQYIQRMEAMPDNSPQDGLTNREHDRIIYGE